MPAPNGSLHDRVLATIGAFYDSALDETLWPKALRMLQDLTGSQASSFWVLNGGGGSLLPTFTVVNIDRRTVDEYLGGMVQFDPTVQYLLAHPDRPVVHDGLLGPGNDESRMYQDWHGRTAGTRFRLVGQTTLGPELQAGVALHRVTNVGRFESRDLERFDVLHGHLKRALTIGARIGTLGTVQQITADCLDRSSAAIILLDQRGRVVFLNRAAEALRKAGDGVQFLSSGLRLASAADNEALQSLICAALAIRTNSPTQAAVMRAARPSGKPAYGIHVTTVRPPSVALTTFRPSVCVIISDPVRSSGPPVLQLQSLFKLTQAEARLAVRLASGESLRGSAAQLGITYGSARSRLMQIFGKTGTRSQSELMRLLLSILPHEG